jgi:myo-inositol-1(or 4)-monophosphatase
MLLNNRSSSGASLSDLLSIAADAAAAGGALLRARGRGSYVGAGIGERDIKLAEDKLSEDCIVACLRERSDLPILSEEAGWRFGRATGVERFWVVDPLDGSFNYFRGVPLCCTSVALCSDLHPILGAICDFNRDELFAGGPGLGVTVNGEPVAAVAARAEMLATGFPVRGDHGETAARAIAAQTRSWKKIRMLGSAALSLAWVATGRIDGYEEHGIMLWDVAAGVALALGIGHVAVLEGVAPDKPLDVSVVARAILEREAIER